MKRIPRPIFTMVVVGMVSAMAALNAAAQDTSRTQTTQGTPTMTTSVERGEVVYVSGNDVVVKMDTGEIRHVVVPDTARATVDGKEVSVRDLKPGMKLQRTITTTSTPKTVKTIRTVEGTVFNVIAPSSVILSFPDGPNKQYMIPKDQKFLIDGKQLTAFELKKGMKIGATVVTESGEISVAETRTIVGTAPPPPPPPPTPVYVGILLIEAAPPAPAPARSAAARPAPAPAPAPAQRAAAAPEPAPTALPKTGSSLPLVGVLGLLFCAVSVSMRMLRRSAR